MTTGADPEAIKQGVAGVFDRNADTYDRTGVDFFTPAGRDLVARAGLRAGERVLDVGCGRGAVLFSAASVVGASGRVVGIDLSRRMAELTEFEARARGLEHVTAMPGDAERPDFAPGSFDAVLAGLVVFMLPDPAGALRRYADLLADGGRIGFTTFGTPDENYDAAMRVLGSFVPGGMAPRSERQGAFGSREGIAELLVGNGFGPPDIAEITYESHVADLDSWLAWVWSHGTRHTLEQVPADRLDEATDAAKQRFAQARTPAGDYVIRTEVRFTTARPTPTDVT